MEWGLRITPIVVFVTVVFVYFRPSPEEIPPELVVGDPISACAYPAGAFGPKMVDKLALIDGIRPVVFDEFIDWRNAERAGYVECK